VPNWVLGYAQAVSGLEFDKQQGGFRNLPAEKRIIALKSYPEESDLWAQLAHWFSQPPSKRTITLNSELTCRQAAELARDSKPLSREGVESALLYDISVPLAHLLLAELIEQEENQKSPSLRDASKSKQAAYLRIYGLKLLPKKDADLWCRAAESMLRQRDYKTCRNAALRALEISPGMPRAAKVLDTLSILPTQNQ
jgi:hypothetical protein